MISSGKKLRVRAAVLVMVGANSDESGYGGEPFKDFYEPLGHEPTGPEWEEQTAYAKKVCEALVAIGGGRFPVEIEKIDTSKMRDLLDELDALKKVVLP